MSMVIDIYIKENYKNKKKNFKYESIDKKNVETC